MSLYWLMCLSLYLYACDGVCLNVLMYLGSTSGENTVGFLWAAECVFLTLNFHDFLAARSTVKRYQKITRFIRFCCMSSTFSMDLYQQNRRCRSDETFNLWSLVSVSLLGKKKIPHMS